MDILTENSAAAVTVRDAVASTLGMMCGGEPDYLGLAPTAEDGERIIGIMSFSGSDALTLVLSLPRASAVALSNAFVGMELDFDGSDMSDVVGEVLNIVAGTVVARLEGCGFKVEMSLPTVVRGTNISLPVPEGLQALRFEFNGAPGLFHVKLVAGAPHADAVRASGR